MPSWSRLSFELQSAATGNQGTSHLGSDGILILPVEIVQLEVLLYFLEQQLDAPALLVQKSYFFSGDIKTVGQELVIPVLLILVTNLPQVKLPGDFHLPLLRYCARCAIELRIKEHKLYLRSDRSSCHSFKANQFRLFPHSMVYVLLHSFQKGMLRGTDFENVTFKTIQNKIIKTAVWVKELKTKVKIELSRCCPTKSIKSNCLEMFSLMRV